MTNFAIVDGAENILWSLFMDTAQLTQDCNAITKREFTFLYLFRGTPSTHLIDHERMKALVNQVIFELQSCRLRTWRPNHWTIAFLFKYV